MNHSVDTTSTKKERAILLRRKGLSYNEISKDLGVPKSTLSSWLKDLPLSKAAKKKNIEKTKLIWAKNIVHFNKERNLKYKKEVKRKLKKYASEISKLNKVNLFYLGLGLYLAEGSKREKWMVRFANSDPAIVKIIMRFFRKICGVKNKDFWLRIHLHPNTSNQKSLRYWSRLTEVSPKNFWRPQTTLSKSSQGKRPANRLPYGTLHITIMNAELTRKIMGWIIGLSAQINK